MAGYTVNFASMEQVNDATGYNRRIARIVKNPANPTPSLTPPAISSEMDLDAELTLKTPFHVSEAIPLASTMLPPQAVKAREKLDGSSHVDQRALKEGRTDTWKSSEAVATFAACLLYTSPSPRD